ncbi:DUF222 domain-containing protein [Microlunatus soli]|uniref:DUF222 domain-containing protein n=1 Tax=Microlunatus soli TaxID=630515 RepID=A0A1H1NT79_9ACTN|nr:DUF222 domain-containing protein [Microlunatus soli]SDS02000.1 protein of unknown function [Microlunatus soli]
MINTPAADTPGSVPAGLDAVQVLRNVSLARRQERAARTKKLIMATCWADCHPPESIDPHQLAIPGGDRPIHPGGDGTPEMAAFAIAEFGAELALSIASTERFIADALDIRHRLPRTWTRLRALEIEGFHAQQIARETRHLSLQQALLVDAAIAHRIGRWAWSRILRHLQAAIIEVDAERIARLAQEAADDTGVFIAQSTELGTKAIYARLSAADAAWFDAMVDRIADILGRRGDQGTKNQRRAAAIGVLANPLHALRLIAEDTAPSLFDPDPDDTSLLPVPSDVDDPASTADHDATVECDAPADHESPVDHEAPVDNDGPVDHDAAVDQDGPVDHVGPVDQDSDGPAPTGADCATIEAAPPRFPIIDPDQRLAEAAIRAIGQLDPARLLPKATLYVHIARETLQNGLGVTRVEDIGPIVSSLVADWLQDCQVTVKPVIDLVADQTTVDAYEIPDAMRERVFLRSPGSVFPYSGSVGRHVDQDHSIPYRDGIPDQTGDVKLGPLARREHNSITHGPWNRRQPQPGTHLFRAPHGKIILVNETGNHDLGQGPFAHRVWQAAAPQNNAA